jgi:hypothetical protein
MSSTLVKRYLLKKASQSGGKPIPYEPIKEYDSNLRGILNKNYKVAYLKDMREIHSDPNHPDRSWEVYLNVVKLKNGLSKTSKLPPIQIVDGKVVDGAHRLSALSLLLSEDPSWGNFKLKVQEFKTEDWNKWKKETGQPADA